MISIITCSINSNYLEKFRKSIDKTIDIEYEIVVIDNNLDKTSISKSYNKGAQIAKYENLVFIHEDVEFLNNNWGSSIVHILQNNKIGVVGIAGSTYLPSVPSGWYLPDEKLNNVYIHQGFKYSKKDVRFDNQGKDLTPVYLLDGVLLAMRKEVWQEFSFNEKVEGFHAYDVDICQRVSAKYQNLFTNQIELLHHSEGKVDKSYFDTILEYKITYLKFNYPKREYKLEIELLKQFYNNIRCFYDKNECISKIKSFHTIYNLGFKGFFQFLKFLKSAK